ncbi:MAG: phosphatidylglycerophosphatase A [Pseudomonadota bacterium]
MATNTSDKKRAPIPALKTVLTDPVHFLAFGFGVGVSPYAPGTLGSVWGILLAWLTQGFGLPIEIGIAVGLCLIGIYLCGESSRRLGVHDHGGIVWDEIAGAYIICLPFPRTIQVLVIAFIMFRVLDIVKPWPIRELDHRLHGGLGIMLDDILAALIGAAFLSLAFGAMTL